ncbi:hypothetical protein BU24DRAFT_86859 [Aaosphaeria arxii CBS 175.79]|uniref:Uncharacterized protein n=1 Tax=Aaosphaeria arxii CBS 175.79 TaxID=1450172 RepID=A0A6A5X8P1_9PLEO|nr:uncharacterized protein BU24DRAFT_86859 [Aaosphaeria arxii CBS 175.79]KAF2009303.1 hypothetical protein BU24DRAFT_86859 [Aaosphaeria arxii CBS 175.79]
MAGQLDKQHIFDKYVLPELAKYAYPDSRFGHDYRSFVPDFRDSSLAIDHVVKLPQYQSAKTILITPDNSLEKLRFRALQDGKQIVVATYGLRRGFVLLNPRKITEDNFEAASWLDGMEKPGIGRLLSLVQIQEEGILIDLFITGASAIGDDGIIMRQSPHNVDIQWLIARERGFISPKAQAVCVVHACQVIHKNAIKTDFAAESIVQYDFIVTPQKVLDFPDAPKFDKEASEKRIDSLNSDALHGIPPLQELAGIRAMEKIMRKSGFGLKEESQVSSPSAEERMAIDMVERLMRGYKA